MPPRDDSASEDPPAKNPHGGRNLQIWFEAALKAWISTQAVLFVDGQRSGSPQFLDCHYYAKNWLGTINYQSGVLAKTLARRPEVKSERSGWEPQPGLGCGYRQIDVQRTDSRIGALTGHVACIVAIGADYCLILDQTHNQFDIEKGLQYDAPGIRRNYPGFFGGISCFMTDAKGANPEAAAIRQWGDFLKSKRFVSQVGEFRALGHNDLL